MQASNESLTSPGLSHPMAHLPLWVVLMTPFIIIITVIVGLTNYLAYQNSHRVVDDIANQLLTETNSRIEAQLTSFVTIPELINRNNARLIESGLLNVSDAEILGRYFREEVQLYDTVTSIYFGNPDGGLVSGGREGADGSLYIITTENFTGGPLTKYATDEQGNLTDVLVRVPDFDSTIRPWYIGAVENGSASWTAPYVLSTGQDMAIASSLPVYNASDTLLGVVSVDIFLSHIHSFLDSLEIGKTGQAFIIEHSGLLVSTSNDTDTFTRAEDGTAERITGVNSDNPVIAEASQYIVDESGHVPRENQQRLFVTLNGQLHYLLVSPFHTDSGLDWVIVIAIPESDFLGSIHAQNNVTISLTIVALVIAIVTGTTLTVLILRPISQLSEASGNLADGSRVQKVSVSGVREMRLLASAFNRMSSQLDTAFTTLEEQITERTAELSVSEARFRGIVEDQTELICRFLPDFTVSFHNDAYKRFYGKPEGEIIGHSFFPQVLEDDKKMLKDKLGSISIDNPLITVEHQVIRGDGQVRWMQWINRGIFDESGMVTEVQSVGRDITGRKHFEARLQQALDREIELNKLKSQFISTVSHEFRTPMAIIMNSSEILQRYSKRLDEQDKEKHYKKIQAQIIHMTQLLDDVLTISRNNTGKLELEKEHIDLHDLVDGIVDEVSASVKNNVSINYSSSGNCGSVLLDIRIIRLIVTNLIGNAAKYSHPGGAVQVNLNCSDDRIIFEVQDSGIGIPESDQADMFEPFYRAKNSANISGTGLGLAIVKRSVEQHGGTIEFSSKEGEGTTFTVHIPISMEQIGNKS